MIKTFISSNGLTIKVGTNAKDNTYLTTKIACPNDIFLHATDLPGAHVILQGTDPTTKDIYEASILAAYFSKRKAKTIIKVDYTEKKNVYRPKKAPLGLVELHKFKTIKVNLSKSETSSILNKEVTS